MTYKVTKLKSIFCLTVTIHFCYYGYIRDTSDALGV